MRAEIAYTLAGMLGSDTAGFNYPTAGTYGTSQAGTGLMVTANGLSLSGINAGDYWLVSSTVATPIGTTGVVPLTTKPAPPLWTITGSPPSGQNRPTGGVVVDL
ncbi:MAG TPA: YDG domain-containing protein [Reyranella sp.]|nr:YDG domain-containing protein [Reyranella sp.]